MVHHLQVNDITACMLADMLTYAIHTTQDRWETMDLLHCQWSATSLLSQIMVYGSEKSFSSMFSLFTKQGLQIPPACTRTLYYGILHRLRSRQQHVNPSSPYPWSVESLPTMANFRWPAQLLRMWSGAGVREQPIMRHGASTCRYSRRWYTQSKRE